MDSKLKQIIRLIIVSPSDVQAERDLIPNVIEYLNKGLADSLGISLEIFRWETDSYPGFNLAGPQGLIDPLLKIEDSDIVIGIFWKRFGTPSFESESGTQHELRKAWASWQMNGRPQIMVYFNEEPYSPKSKAEIEQWAAVFDFKENFPQDGLWWPYSGKIEFENLIRNHLTNFIKQNYKVPEVTHNDKTTDYLFEVPHFIDQIERASLLSQLDEKFRSHSVVAIEGLPGSGKTYLATSYFSSGNYLNINKRIIWHDPQNNETVDDFLAHVGRQIKLSASSTTSRCKELLSYVNRNNILLVIDDFHRVNPASFSVFVNLALRFSNPANLLLISRTYIGLLANMPQIGHIEVRGFAFKDMQTFLNKRSVVGIKDVVVLRLIEKTDGLPLAASLFATLVHDFNRRPSDLLSDSMLSTELLSNWFKEVSSLISDNESSLLKLLSICDGPFNIGIVRSLGRLKKIENVDLSFEVLQRTYLVQSYTPYRWNIHHLIAQFCYAELNEVEKRLIHLELAEYYLKGFYVHHARILPENEFTWKVRACKQFQLAKRNEESQKIINDITKTSKVRGFYEILIQLIENQISLSEKRDSWLDYHYSHCCLITGKLKRGLDAIEPLLYTLEKDDANKRVAFTRLYAEIIGSMGNARQGLKKLNEMLDKTEFLSVRPSVLNQAISTQVWLLTILQEYEKALNYAEDTLSASLKMNDKLGVAIAFTRQGIISISLNDVPAACNKLEYAISVFRELEEKRGLAWALSNLALGKFVIDDVDGAILNLREAVRIENDIGGCSLDYFNVLNSIKKECKNKDLLDIIDIELQRVGTAMDDIILKQDSLFANLNN